MSIVRHRNRTKSGVFLNALREVPMMHAGYKWSLKEDAGQWRWQAIGRDDQTMLVQGVARTRAEAAACLVRAMARGVICEQSAVAA